MWNYLLGSDYLGKKGSSKIEFKDIEDAIDEIIKSKELQEKDKEKYFISELKDEYLNFTFAKNSDLRKPFSRFGRILH